MLVTLYTDSEEEEGSELRPVCDLVQRLPFIKLCLAGNKVLLGMNKKIKSLPKRAWSKKVKRCTSRCAFSSSLSRISRASARAARFAANLASASRAIDDNESSSPFSRRARLPDMLFSIQI